MHVRNTLATLAALASLAAIGYIALAQSAGAQGPTIDPDRVSVMVSYADLNLESAAGAATMLRRVDHAAQTICGPEPSDRLQGMKQYRGCVREIVDSAVSRLGSPTVTALNAGVRTNGKVMLATAKR